MKSISKKIILSSLILTAVFDSFAFDFGGTVNDTTKYSGTGTSNLTLDQKNAATLWARTPFNNAGTLYLAAEGTAQWNYVQNTNSTIWSADCTLFKFGGIFNISTNSKFLLSVGRYPVTDATGLIFTQASDGILANLNMQRFTMSVYGGYTGLLNAQNITELNASDSAYTYDSTKVYDFAAPYAVGGLTFTAPYLFANQTLGVQFYGFFGVPGIDDTTTSGYNRLYGTLSLNGPLASSVFYTLTSTIGTNDMFKTFGNLSQVQLGWYPSFKSSSISVKCVYASGKNGVLSPFVGFTSNSATVSVTAPQYTGLMMAGLSASIKPVAPLYISAGADCVFACPDDSFAYSGFQYNTTIRYQVMTDVQMTVLVNQYFAKDEADNKLTLTAKAVISF